MNATAVPVKPAGGLTKFVNNNVTETLSKGLVFLLLGILTTALTPVGEELEGMDHPDVGDRRGARPQGGSAHRCDGEAGRSGER